MVKLPKNIFPIFSPFPAQNEFLSTSPWSVSATMRMNRQWGRIRARDESLPPLSTPLGESRRRKRVQIPC